MIAHAADKSFALEFFGFEKRARQKNQQGIGTLSWCQSMQMCIQRIPLDDGDFAATSCQRYRDVKLINRFL